MSIFTNISNAAHTFVAWFEAEITKLVNSAPTIEQTAAKGFQYAAAVLGIVLAQVTPGSEAAKVLAEAISDIKTISSVVYDAGAHPTVGTLIQDVVGNLNALLSAGHISNAGLVNTITKVVSTLAALVSAFATVAPVVAAA